MSASGPSGPLVIYSNKLDKTFTLFLVGHLMDKKNTVVGHLFYFTITLVTKNQPRYELTYFSSLEPKARDELIVWDSSQRPYIRPSVHSHF